MPINDSKPGTVTTAQVFLWIGVAASALAVCLIGGALGSAGAGAPAAAQLALTITIIVIVPFAVLSGILAVKLGAGRNWARITTVVLYSISLALTVVTVLTGLREFGIDALISMTISLVVVLCLTGPAAKRWCGLDV